VGLILIVIGGIVILSGIYQIVDPPAVKTVLAETNPSIWWGALMTAFGGVLFWKTRKL
jgi:LPXTG-motif cell wall-anchored protein